jgi:hypothetical protein
MMESGIAAANERNEPQRQQRAGDLTLAIQLLKARFFLPFD